MTKRAGKKSKGVGTSQRVPPSIAPIRSSAEGMDEGASDKVERRAIREGWLIADSDQLPAVDVKQGIIRKLAKQALSDDPEVSQRAARLLLIAEKHVLDQENRERDQELKRKVIDKGAGPLVSINTGQDFDRFDKFFQSLSPELAQAWLDSNGAEDDEEDTEGGRTSGE